MLVIVWESGEVDSKNDGTVNAQEQKKISDQLGPLPVKPYHLHQISQELTLVSSLQLGTAKLFAYAELIKSEFNKISEIFPICINFSQFADMIERIIRNS